MRVRNFERVHSEGAVQSYSLIFSNGLVLDTQKVLWLGKEGREDVLRKFMEVVDAIEDGTLTYDPELEA